MKTQAALAFAAAALAMTGCSSVSTNTDWDRSYDFSGPRTYNWIHQTQESMGENINDLDVRRIQGSVDQAIAAQGFTKASATQATYLIAFHTGSQTQTQYNTYGYGMGGWYYGGMGMTTTTATQYEQGTLLVDVVDRAKNETVWRGTAKATIDDNSEVNLDNLNKATQKLFAKFPPTGEE